MLPISLPRSRELAKGLLAIFALLLLSGYGACPQNRYEIELDIEQGKLQRTLTCVRSSATMRGDISEPCPQEELRRFAQVYPKPPREQEPPRSPEASRYVGLFGAKLPEDIGGIGRFLSRGDSFGEAGIYIERFRGESDRSEQLRRTQEALDTSVDHLIGWLQAELGDEAGFKNLRAFLDGQLRRDLHNLALHGILAVWLDDLDDRPMAEGLPELGMNVALFLVERGYADVEQLEELTSVFYRSLPDPTGKPALQYARRYLAGKMGIPKEQPLPESFYFLGNLERLERSMKRYLSTTVAFAEMQARWQAQPEATRGEAPAPGDVTEKLLRDIFGGTLGASDVVTVQLALPSAPLLSNGQWQPQEKRVVWKNKAIRSRIHMPTIAFAVWSTPNETFQKTHFGKSVLAGDALIEYLVWNEALTAEERAQWQRFLATLKPNKQLAKQLRAFRFESERATQNDSLAEPAIRLLTRNLTSDD